MATIGNSGQACLDFVIRGSGTELPRQLQFYRRRSQAAFRFPGLSESLSPRPVPGPPDVSDQPY